MKNISHKPPNFAIKFANIVFILGILYSVLIAIYAAYRINQPIYQVYAAYRIHQPIYQIEATPLIKNNINKFYYSSILICGIAATLLGLGLRSGNNLKINLSILFVTVFIVVYGVETYFEFQQDAKTKLLILKKLNDSGIKAYPDVGPTDHLTSNGLRTAEGKIYPLGGISNITTVIRKESHYHPIIKTDEHGFNNPKGLYTKNKVDIVLIGDSFAKGYAVHPSETISAVLQESGFSAINFGMGGNGPLIELASLKEYAEPLKPKIVLWLYYPNDLFDLEKEMQSSFLKKYLNEDDFSQSLISRQIEIDSVLKKKLSLLCGIVTICDVIDDVKLAESNVEIKNLIQEEADELLALRRKILKELEREKIANYRVIRIFKLRNIRKKIALMPLVDTKENLNFLNLSSTTKPIFKDVLQKSKQIVSKWGGGMYFVYLTPFSRYLTGNEEPNREFVMRTVAKLEIPIIDIHKETFALDPLSLFPSGMKSQFNRSDVHYNAEGYQLVAKAIGNKLKEDGVIPTNLGE